MTSNSTPTFVGAVGGAAGAACTEVCAELLELLEKLVEILDKVVLGRCEETEEFRVPWV